MKWIKSGFMIFVLGCLNPIAWSAVYTTLEKKQLLKIEHEIVILQEQQSRLLAQLQNEKINLGRFVNRWLEKNNQTVQKEYLRSLIQRSLREIEAQQVDLQDCEELLQQQVDQKQYLVQEVENRSLNQKLQGIRGQLEREQLITQIKSRQQQQVVLKKQLHQDEELKKLLGQFHERMELQESSTVHDRSSQLDQRALTDFFQEKKAKLPSPLQLNPGEKAKVKFLTPALEPEERMSQRTPQRTQSHLRYQLDGVKNIQAIASGKVVFVGVISDLGQTVILSHGQHYYTVSAHCSQVQVVQGQEIKERQIIAATEENQFYFELRRRNIRLNPLQWLAN